MDYLNPVEGTMLESVDSWASNLNLIHLGVEAALHASGEKMVVYANRKRTDHKFKVGDLVWLSTENIRVKRPSRKLDVKRIGPFKIIKFINSVSVRLDLPSKVRIHPVFHVNLLAPFKAPQKGQSRPTPYSAIVDSDGVPILEVKKILNARRCGNSLEFLVSWVDEAHEDSWQPLVDVLGCWKFVRDFYKRCPEAPRPSQAILNQNNLSL